MPTLLERIRGWLLEPARPPIQPAVAPDPDPDAALRALQGQHADVLASDRFISVSTLSGHGVLGTDPRAPEHVLAPDASNEALGTAVLHALEASRVTDVAGEREIFGDDWGASRWAAWERATMARLGLRRRTDLYAGLLNVGVRRAGGVVSCTPTRHVRGAAWEGLATEEAAVVQEGDAPARLGAAVRDALARSRKA